MLAPDSRVRAARGGPAGHQRLALEQQRNGVHHPDHRVLGEAVALLQGEREQPAAGLRGHRHLGRLEVAVGVDVVLPAGGAAQDGHRGATDGGVDASR